MTAPLTEYGPEVSDKIRAGRRCARLRLQLADAIQDGLLVNAEGDAHVHEVGEGDVNDGVEGRVSSLAEHVDVVLHVQSRQPALDAVVGHRSAVATLKSDEIQRRTRSETWRHLLICLHD